MYIKTLFSFLKHRELVWEMGLRELKVTNKGAILGFLWVIISPLVQVLAYVIIISFIFKVKFSDDSGSGTFDYAVYILSGMIPWQILAKSLQEAPGLIRNNTELVKQVIYPIEILPLTNLLVSSFGSVINFGVFAVFLLTTKELNISMLLLPLPTILLFMLILGISWAFSTIGVILKDLKEMVVVAMSLLIYASPVVINETMVNPKIWKIIMLNPLSHPVICFRDVFWGEFHLTSWIVFITLSLISFSIGGLIITKAKITINEYI